MPVALTTRRVTEPMPIPNFTWDPVGAAVTFNFAGNAYPPAGARFEAFYTPTNQLVTFTATVVASPNVPVVEYRWDLGDGTIKYGATVGHTYTVPNQSLTARLEVTDALTRKAYVAKSLQLQVQFPTITHGKARVAPS